MSETACQITFTCTVHEAQLLAALRAALDPNNDLTTEMALDALPTALGLIRDNLRMLVDPGESIQDAFGDANWSPHEWAFVEEFVLELTP